MGGKEEPVFATGGLVRSTGRRLHVPSGSYLTHEQLADMQVDSGTLNGGKRLTCAIRSKAPYRPKQ